jgi:DNA primase small subunit
VDDLTKAYLSKKFKEYYESARLDLPRDFEKREWAFVPFEKLPDFFMQRHVSFTSEEELRSSILSSPPAHVFYSSACYSNPEDPMERKNWLYADLIFDIDADHLPLKNKNIESAIKAAKKEIIRLHSILQRDFGVSERQMKIVFSGGRGYHLHVFDEELQRLGSAERREIIDYLSINPPAGRSLQLNRVRRCMLSYFKDLKRKGRLKEVLKRNGIRKTEKIERTLEMLLTNRELEKRFISGEFEFKSRNKNFQNFVSKVAKMCVSKHSIHLDAPVTADIKRLIRFPGSIHGKSGLITMEVDIDSIREFDPFKDAIAFGDEKVKLTILPEESVKLRLGGEEFKFRGGERAVAPEFVAIHLLCRGVARYGH